MNDDEKTGQETRQNTPFLIEEEKIPREPEVPPPPEPSLEEQVQDLRKHVESLRIDLYMNIQAIPDTVRTSILGLMKEIDEGKHPPPPPPGGGQPSITPSESHPVTYSKEALGAVEKQAELEIMQRLSQLSPMDKILFMTRNIQGAQTLIESIRGTHQPQQIDLAGQLQPLVASLKTVFELTNSMFELAAETVGRVKGPSADEKLIERVVQRVLQEREPSIASQ